MSKVTTIRKPRLSIVPPAPVEAGCVKPERYGDYRDYLKRPSRSWAISHTEKQPGDHIATGTGFDRHG